MCLKAPRKWREGRTRDEGTGTQMLSPSSHPYDLLPSAEPHLPKMQTNFHFISILIPLLKLEPSRADQMPKLISSQTFSTVSLWGYTYPNHNLMRGKIPLGLKSTTHHLHNVNYCGRRCHEWSGGYCLTTGLTGGNLTAWALPAMLHKCPSPR